MQIVFSIADVTFYDIFLSPDYSHKFVKDIYINIVWKKINQVFFIFNVRELSINRKDLQAYPLVGLNRGNPILDP